MTSSFLQAWIQKMIMVKVNVKKIEGAFKSKHLLKRGNDLDDKENIFELVVKNEDK